MKERVGLIYVSQELIYQEMDAVGEMLAYLKFIPCHAEYEFAYKRFKYIGFSRYFEKISEGSMAPEYKIEITDTDGVKEYQVIKAD